MNKLTRDDNVGASILRLDVRPMAPALKHPAVLNLFDKLAGGESFLLINDHDPKPLYYQLMAQRGSGFSWKYVEKGPGRWLIRIGKENTGDGPTIGAIVAGDIRKAEVFRRHGLDFCCGGKKTLRQACLEKGLIPDEIETELNAVGRRKNADPDANYNEWEPDALVDYIYAYHHRYYYDERPVIASLMEKVVQQHGSRYPYLQQVADTFALLVQELDVHFMKEERVIFPFIKTMTADRRDKGADLSAMEKDIMQPLQMMEADHNAAGEILARMRKLTGNYMVPDDGCSSFRLLYHKLEALEQDLQVHIHLENNVLFAAVVSSKWGS